MAIQSLLQNLFGKPYTIGELMNIDQGRQSRASGCTVSLANSFFTMSEEGVLAKFKAFFSTNTIKVVYLTLKFIVRSDTGHTHTVFIQLDPDFTKMSWAANHVRIYCDCADFKYRSAYLLDKRKSLFANDKIKIALGQAITDKPDGKRGTTLLCKHSFAALQYLMSNYGSIMATL